MKKKREEKDKEETEDGEKGEFEKKFGTFTSLPGIYTRFLGTIKFILRNYTLAWNCLHARYETNVKSRKFLVPI